MGRWGGRGPTQSYVLEMSRAALHELLRALGVRDRPLPARLRRHGDDPTLYMDVRPEGVLLWQHGLPGRPLHVLPLRVVEGDRATRVDVLRPRMPPAIRLALVAAVVVAPLMTLVAGPWPLVPLVGGVACGLWLQRGLRSHELEQMLHENLVRVGQQAHAFSFDRTLTEAGRSPHGVLGCDDLLPGSVAPESFG